MCNLSNEECKELVTLLKGYQEFIIKKELDLRVETMLEKLLPYARKCDDTNETASQYEEYDPQY